MGLSVRCGAPVRVFRCTLGSFPDTLRCESSGRALKTVRRSGVEDSGGVTLPLAFTHGVCPFSEQAQNDRPNFEQRPWPAR
jgi:hypothetical protein